MKRIEVTTLRWRPFVLHLSELFESSWRVIKSRTGILLRISDFDRFEGFSEVNPMPNIQRELTLLNDIGITPLPTSGEIQIPNRSGCGISPEVDMLETVAAAPW